MNCSPPGSSTGFPRQESWSGLPFPPPWYLPNTELKPTSPAGPTLADRFFTTLLLKGDMGDSWMLLRRWFTSFKSQTFMNTSYVLGTVLTGMTIKTVFLLTHTSVPAWKADRSSGRVIQDSFVRPTTNESRDPYSQAVYNLVREVHKQTNKKDVRKG